MAGGFKYPGLSLSFIFGYAGSSWLGGLSQVAGSGGSSSLRCTGFSSQWLLSAASTDSRVRGLQDCGPWTSLPRGVWDLLRPGAEPLSSALAGEFLTTGPPGKSTLTLLTLGFVSNTGSRSFPRGDEVSVTYSGSWLEKAPLMGEG